ncbi:hypothetical protein [Sphingobium sp.]|uniref:hypothetical protein n=1 Tax=Sphingobium sp. TaxID=1912891 RepID=UPI000C5B63C2|nr:hypothetical protein [Sphingobium sp.]MBS90842.1 hypothetical protein [Sphingobium sp.]
MDFAALLTRAHAAAKEAAKGVTENVNEFDCGNAKVVIDGREPLANYCRKMIRQAGARLEGSEKRIAESNASLEHGTKGYPTGWQWYKPGDDARQSIRIHEAAANAFRAVLTEANIRAEVISRLD